MRGGSQWQVNGETHYQRHKEEYIARVRARQRELKALLRSLKEESGCVDCGIKDFRVLDFDHVGKKTITPSRMALRGWGKERIQKELAECEVRCSNCHRIVTYERAHTPS